jgi:hypothetical protein
MWRVCIIIIILDFLPDSVCADALKRPCNRLASPVGAAVRFSFLCNCWNFPGLSFVLRKQLFFDDTLWLGYLEISQIEGSRKHPLNSLLGFNIICKRHFKLTMIRLLCVVFQDIVGCILIYRMRKLMAHFDGQPFCQHNFWNQQSRCGKIYKSLIESGASLF